MTLRSSATTSRTKLTRRPMIPGRSASLTLTPFCTGGPAFLPAPAVFGFVTVPVRPLPRARDRCSALSSSSSTRSSSISSSSSSSSSARASSSTTSSRRSSTASSPRRFRLATSRPLPSNLRIVSRGSNAWPRLPRLPRRLRPALEWPARCGRPVREPVEPSAQGRQDSNLQPAVLETAALPIAPHPCARQPCLPRARRDRGQSPHGRQVYGLPPGFPNRAAGRDPYQGPRHAQHLLAVADLHRELRGQPSPRTTSLDQAVTTGSPASVTSSVRVVRMSWPPREAMSSTTHTHWRRSPAYTGRVYRNRCSPWTTLA